VEEMYHSGLPVNEVLEVHEIAGGIVIPRNHLSEKFAIEQFSLWICTLIQR
jgi:hypothetical protein